MDGIDYVALTMMIFNICVYCPILIHYLLLYRQYEKQEVHKSTTNVIHHRNSFLVYTINILAIFTNCTERIFMVSSEVWGIIHVPFWTVSFFLAVTWWALMDLFAIKVYHLYYQQQLNQSMADNLWRKSINPQIDDWYIRNQNKYGNSLYLIKLAFIPYLLSVVIDAGFFAFLLGGGVLLDLSHLTLATIPTCIAMAVFWKARKLDDVYNIRNEILYQFIIVLSALSVYMIILVVCNYIIGEKDVAHRHSDNVHRFEMMSYIFITDVVTFALALFSTLYPIYLTKKNENESHLLQLEHSGNSEQPTIVYGMQGINALIRDYESFKTFMEYLVSEFCPENALFLVELIQIKHVYQVRNHNVVRVPKQSIIKGRDILENKTDNNMLQVIDFNVNVYPDSDIDVKHCIYSYIFHEDGTIKYQITLTSKVPSSEILSAEPNKLYSQMKMLYEKYVKVGSEYELNIPYAMRESLKNCFEVSGFEEMDECTWFNVMDTCCAEVLLLLGGSYRRFVHSPKYRTRGKSDATSPSVDDVTMKKILNSGKLPVVRNVTSYTAVKEQYTQLK